MATIKDLERMCMYYSECCDCPLSSLTISGICGIYNFPASLDEIVGGWVEAHPLKTYAHDFLKKFPNAELDSYGAPRACVNAIYGLGDCSKSEISGIICRDCWNQRMKD